MRSFWAVVGVVLGVGIWGGCGGSALGETCSTEGSTDPCASGLLCGKETDGSLRCQKICAAQTDCPTGQECNGTVGTLKSCRVKK